MTAPIELDTVSPGQLITARGWLALTDAIEDLRVRVSALEAGGPTTGSSPGAPVLNTRTPTGDLHPHDLVTLLGQNFSPLSKARVNFGPVMITSFGAGSDDSHLSFTVPSITPQAVAITVSTPQGTSSKTLTANVLAEVVPQGGTVDVQASNDPLNPPSPVAGQPLQLQWSVKSNTMFPDTYSFDVEFSNVQPASANWTATLTTSQHQIAAGASYTVIATVAVPNDPNASANVTLKATSQTDPNHRWMAATPLTLTVGEDTPTSDPRIGLTVVDPQPFFDMDGNPSNVTLIRENNLPVILIGKNAPGFVEIQVDFHDAGATPPVNYRFFSEVADTTHWSADAVSPPTLVQTLLNGTATVLFNLTNLATNANPNDTQFTVSAAKLKADSTDDYVSFAPISIRNAG
jgi:hypothetical protein